MPVKRAWAALAAVAILTVAACSGVDRGADVDVQAAEDFDAFPLVWVGERFEQWELRSIELPGPAGFATFSYGDCEVVGRDGGCAPPLQIQIAPLCAQLQDVAQAPIWQRRSIRGAPVGTIDSAPVLFTSGAQVKVYRGQASDAGLALRALRALRSVNRVEPVIDAGGPIPPPSLEVLAGTQPCRPVHG